MASGLTTAPTGLVAPAVAVFDRAPVPTSASVTTWLLVQVIEAPAAKVVAGQRTGSGREDCTATALSAALPVSVTTYWYGWVSPMSSRPSPSASTLACGWTDTV